MQVQPSTCVPITYESGLYYEVITVYVKLGLYLICIMQLVPYKYRITSLHNTICAWCAR